MKLSEIHPCDKCSGPVGTTFQIVRHTPAVVNSNVLRQHLAMASYLGTDPLSPIAENFAPTESAVHLMAEMKDGPGWDELLLCHECFAQTLGHLIERKGA